MAISLKKGGKISLTKENSGLDKIIIGLGWDVNCYDTGTDFDLDASAFLLDANGKCRNENDFVFYGAAKHPSGAVTHTGDNRTGDGEGDDETIMVELSKVPADVERIAFTVTIYDADARKQNFGQVSNAYIHVIDAATNNELVSYDLGEDFSVETAVVVAEIYKHGNEWKFNAIGSGYQGGLASLCAQFGIDAA